MRSRSTPRGGILGQIICQNDESSTNESGETALETRSAHNASSNFSIDHFPRFLPKQSNTETRINWTRVCNCFFFIRALVTIRSNFLFDSDLSSRFLRSLAASSIPGQCVAAWAAMKFHRRPNFENEQIRRSVWFRRDARTSHNNRWISHLTGDTRSATTPIVVKRMSGDIRNRYAAMKASRELEVIIALRMSQIFMIISLAMWCG